MPACILKLLIQNIIQQRYNFRIQKFGKAYLNSREAVPLMEVD